jgi:hypothetical protein
MSDQPEEHHPRVVERIKQHHEQAKQRREEAELEADMAEAGFDLGTDIGHPTGPNEFDDVQRDLSIESDDPQDEK